LISLKIASKIFRKCEKNKNKCDKRIINNNLKEVLEYIINVSTKIDNEIKKKAKNILKNNFKI